MTLTQILESLTDAQREQLMLSFEIGKTAVLEYNKSKFIAVNLHYAPSHLVVKETCGLWCCGDIL